MHQKTLQQLIPHNAIVNYEQLNPCHKAHVCSIALTMLTLWKLLLSHMQAHKQYPDAEKALRGLARASGKPEQGESKLHWLRAWNNFLVPLVRAWLLCCACSVQLMISYKTAQAQILQSLECTGLYLFHAIFECDPWLSFACLLHTVGEAL